MRVDIVTLFPELFETFLATSFVGRAIKGGELAVRLRSPREHGLGKHRSVDDTPYGGGSGMVMRVDVLVACMEALDAEAAAAGEPRARRILLTPQGAPFAQPAAARLAVEPAFMLVCGRYEGFDERVRGFVDEEISLGDFVMTGGEVAAMAIVEATVRLVPGVLGNAESIREESHGEGGLLEYPQYTRPAEFRGLAVPDVLAGGNHAEIAKWRVAQALSRTRERRPDLLAPGASAARAPGPPSSEPPRAPGPPAGKARE
ncbi:MAG: tRNA (guanosine(37)-N1)-methyltransferase TrmD [Labilithrix sp.]|nr:tRNA (guanosine(37)-N1)-methyltransferase TrmD [Labilithrix sp.]